MRIISGSARGKNLAAFAGREIRPTSDRVREAVFSSLYSLIGSFESRRVLDLFAGTGAMGLEALSRGADTATFMDKSMDAARTIRRNVENCGFTEKAVILHASVFDSKLQLQKLGPFDIVFLDPPYGKGLVEKALETLIEIEVLTSGAMICIEMPAHDQLPEHLRFMMFIKNNRYGSTQISFFRASGVGEET